MFRWIQYYLRAKTIHQVHSPYLYDLLHFILDEDRRYYIFNTLEKERIRLQQDKAPFLKNDYGAGSRRQKQKHMPTTIGRVAKTSLSNRWQCAVLFRLAEFIGARQILEMGTSFGVSTLYLAGNPQRHVTAMEGDEGCIEILRAMATRLHFQNLHLLCGPFVKTLPKLGAEKPLFDLVFMDGHHLEEPTLDYFQKIRKWLHDQSVVVIDDIHWSAGMEQAWSRLKESPSVTQSVDLYHFGLLFFRREFLEKQHHTIIPKQYKPWRV